MFRLHIDTSGFDKLRRNLRDVEGERQVPLADLLSPAFLSSHTTFTSLEDLIAASGFKVETAEDFRAIPDDQWDAFISSRTRFSDWQNMLSEAAASYVARKLGV